MEIAKDEKDQSAVEIKTPVEHKLVGSVTLRPGQKLWVYDPATNDLSEVIRNRVQYEPANFPEGIPAKIHGKASFDASKYYCVAINRSNAARKIAAQIKAAAIAAGKESELQATLDANE